MTTRTLVRALFLVAHIPATRISSGSTVDIESLSQVTSDTDNKPSFGDKNILEIQKIVNTWSSSKVDAAWNRTAKGGKDMAAVALANPSSGGNKGKTLLALLASDHKWVKAVSLPVKDKDKQVLDQVLAEGWANGKGINAARAICGGGDGTIGWCLSTIAVRILKAGGSDDGDDPDLATAIAIKNPNFNKYLPIFIMCPLGTGNDLSRSIGWGSGFPQKGVGDEAKREKAGLNDWIGKVKSIKEISRFDVWRAQFSKSAQCKTEDDLLAGKIDPDGFMLVFLYLSTGWDAVAAAAFERTSKEGVLGQSINKGKHMLNGVKTMQTMSSESMGVTCVEGCPEKLEVNQGGTLAIINTPSMWSGAFPWGIPKGDGKWTPSQLYDKKIEMVKSVAVIDGNLKSRMATWNRYSSDAKTHLPRVGQGSNILLTWTAQKGRLFQVDGEGGLVCDGAGALQVTHGGSIRVLSGPFRRPFFLGTTEKKTLKQHLEELTKHKSEGSVVSRSRVKRYKEK